MSVEPLVLDVSSLGKDSTQSFRVTNDGSGNLPVEIRVARLDIEPDGTLRYEPAEEDFLIYPPQANIQEGAAQIFRVQWLGSPEINESHTYRLSVSQVPVKQPDSIAGIQITMNFGVIVSVSPPGGNAAIVVMNANRVQADDGKVAAALLVKNPGNKHAYLRDAEIILSAGSWSQKLTPFEVGQKVGLGIIQPGKERRFIMPVEVPPGVTGITASIDYKPEK